MENKNQLNHYLSKAMRYCSRSEHCISDVTQKLAQWQTPEELYNDIIHHLVQENFIDETRFANAFVNDKFKFDKWGKLKIKYALAQKQIPQNIISQTIQNIDPEEYVEIAIVLMKKKTATVKEQNIAGVKQKIFRFMTSRGFEPNLIYELFEEHIQQ